MLQTGGTYVGDLPCQWCNKNPYKLSCGTTTATVTNENTNGGTYGSAYNRIVKGSN